MFMMGSVFCLSGRCIFPLYQMLSRVDSVSHQISPNLPTLSFPVQGFVKGYALVEYGEKKEAQTAIDTLNGSKLMEKEIAVDWAFKKGAAKKR